MKLYIVGAVASGKSTLAKKISSKTGAEYFELDKLVHEPDSGSPWGNKKRSAQERDALFNAILRKQNWIIEDVGRKCFEKGLAEADIIVWLDPPAYVRNFRIVKRWVKQRTGMESCLYRPSCAMLRCMLQWSKDYDSGKDGLKESYAQYGKKVLRLRNAKEIKNFLNK